MLHCKRPKGHIKACRPMNHLMHHEGQGPGCDGLHTTFSHPVLEVGADSTEGQSLILKGTIFTKLVTTKRMIIRMIVLDLDTKLIGESLQGMLAEEGFTCTQGNLVSYEGETSGMINVESPAIVLNILAFLSTCTW
jgi:hypothetical protein